MVALTVHMSVKGQLSHNGHWGCNCPNWWRETHPVHADLHIDLNYQVIGTVGLKLDKVLKYIEYLQDKSVLYID